ncbi:hypothetical protein JCM9534A_16070 [Catenuloplanes indicus JCM 9534]|uniref:Uncharacterized protein n=1 Tax=Catenuloplanes indicus TaxID=137267 RepID=A0AAE4AWF2_9ACTN|nr:hypothetical protein [Catenuloplanes indicus]
MARATDGAWHGHVGCGMRAHRTPQPSYREEVVYCADSTAGRGQENWAKKRQISTLVQVVMPLSV